MGLAQPTGRHGLHHGLPVRAGAVDEQALAATGAREVTGVATGFNLPAGRIEVPEDSEMFEELYDPMSRPRMRMGRKQPLETRALELGKEPVWRARPKPTGKESGHSA